MPIVLNIIQVFIYLQHFEQISYTSLYLSQ